MTQEEIIKGNNLIAEFMEYEIAGTDGDTSAVLAYYFPDNHPTHAGMVSADSLLFNSSWDWLMPVVEKIEKDRNCIIIDGTSCHIDSNDGQYSETNCCTMNNRFETDKDTESKIESTWMAVVEFINWYNKNKK